MAWLLVHQMVVMMERTSDGKLARQLGDLWDRRMAPWMVTSMVDLMASEMVAWWVYPQVVVMVVEKVVVWVDWKVDV